MISFQEMKERLRSAVEDAVKEAKKTANKKPWEILAAKNKALIVEMELQKDGSYAPVKVKR